MSDVLRLACERCGGRGWTLVANAAPGTWPERCRACAGYGGATLGQLARTFSSACTTNVCAATLEKNARRVLRGESMRAETAFAILEIACAALALPRLPAERRRRRA